MSNEERGSQTYSAIDLVKDQLDACDSHGSVGVETVVTLAILNIVSDPASVKVSITRAAKTIILEYDVLPEDKGKLIGKDGHTIDALRSLSRSIVGGGDEEYLIYLLGDRRPRTARPQPRGGGFRGGGRRKW